MARTSAADLAHGLKGAKFPMSKKDLVSLAQENGVAEKVLQTFEKMPDGEYGSVTDVEHAFHEEQSGEGHHATQQRLLRRADNIATAVIRAHDKQFSTAPREQFSTGRKWRLGWR